MAMYVLTYWLVMTPVVMSMTASGGRDVLCWAGRRASLPGAPFRQCGRRQFGESRAHAQQRAHTLAHRTAIYLLPPARVMMMIFWEEKEGSFFSSLQMKISISDDEAYIDIVCVSGNDTYWICPYDHLRTSYLILYVCIVAGRSGRLSALTRKVYLPERPVTAHRQRKRDVVHGKISATGRYLIPAHARWRMITCHAKARARGRRMACAFLMPHQRARRRLVLGAVEVGAAAARRAVQCPAPAGGRRGLRPDVTDPSGDGEAPPVALLRRGTTDNEIYTLPNSRSASRDR